MGEELQVTSANIDSETGSGVALVDFWAPWCGPCRMQGPIIERVAKRLAGKAKIGKCNVDDEQSLAGKLGIRSIPTLIIFKDGQEVERLTGVQPEESLVERLTKLL